VNSPVTIVDTSHPVKTNHGFKQKWIKKGLIFDPFLANAEWMVSHASVPTAEHVRGNLFRIYFSTRNTENKTQGSYIVIDITDPTKILEISKQPCLSLGDLGCFDDSAAWPSWIVNTGSKKYLYYIGWNAGKTVPFYSSIGLAISSDQGKSFTRYSKAPLLGRTDKEPHLSASSCVLYENGRWRMWYLSGVKWVVENGYPKHFYHIKYADSDDGIHWNREGKVAINFKSNDEYAIARPCVLKKGSLYKMWYSYRGGTQTYRIGYAESTDGIKWNRKDGEVSLDISSAGWDSDMICYPFVFEHKNDTYMLYNGNGYGKTGFGLAILEKA